MADTPGRSSISSQFSHNSPLTPLGTLPTQLIRARLNIVSTIAIAARVGVRGGAVLVVARLAVLVVGAPLADARGLGVVAGAHLVRARVHGQGVGVAEPVRVGALAAPQAEEPALPGRPVARGVVVRGRGPEALLLLAVAAQGELCQGGDYEEDAGWWVSTVVE